MAERLAVNQDACRFESCLWSLGLCVSPTKCAGAHPAGQARKWHRNPDICGRSSMVEQQVVALFMAVQFRSVTPSIE